MNRRSKKRVFSNSHNNLLEVDFLDFKRYYGTTILIEKEGTDPQHLSYENKIICKQKRHNSWLLEVDRKNLRVNHEMPNNTMDYIAYACGQVLYPMQILVTNQLNIESIENFADIQKKWINVKNSLQEKYDKTSLLNNYFKVMDPYMKNLEAMIEVIKRDFFLASYCSPIHGKPYDFIYNSSDVYMKIPIVPNTKPVNYKVTQKVRSTFTSFGTITIEHEGAVLEERTPYDLSIRSNQSLNKREENVQGKLKSTYQLDKDTKTISSIIANYDIILPNNESRKISFKTFHLAERDKEFLS